MPSQPLQPLLDDTVAAYAQLVAADDQTQCFANLLDVEQQVAQLTVELGRRLLQTFTEVRRQQAKATPRRCACGRLMEWHAASQWRHGTQFGDLHVSDAYAYCRTCHASARPVHGWLGTGVERWSLAVQEKVVDLAADESCQRAVAKLQRHHPGLVVGRSTALRLLHRHGARAREFVAEKLAAALAAAAQEGRRAG
ncbi:MAG: hypothetical protein HY744_31020, partial [Deltaproteobacteria bacterium]|nr:hypothetical protein [Deltaproteobacteria bacterium]